MRLLTCCVALLALAPASVLAASVLQCPAEPAAIAQGPAAVRSDISASAALIGKLATDQVEAQLRNRYPQLKPDELEQALHVAYCQRLIAQSELTDAERYTRWKSLHTPAELTADAAGSSPAGSGSAPAMAPQATTRSFRAESAQGLPLNETDHRPPPSPVEIPAFPWPPPPPSAARLVPGGVLTARIKELEAHNHKVLAVKGKYHLRDVDTVLRRSLRATGYEFRYYSTPRGFALVARLERIDDKGAPFPNQTRFDATFRPLQGFTLMSYLAALFVAPPGHYRVITFIVSPEPFQANGRPVTSEEASAWLEGGVNILPKDIGDLEYTLPDYACTALIYEFDKRDTQSNPVELHPGRLSADTHLDGSGIAKLLWNRLYP